MQTKLTATILKRIEAVVSLYNEIFFVSLFFTKSIMSLRFFKLEIQILFVNLLKKILPIYGKRSFLIFQKIILESQKGIE